MLTSPAIWGRHMLTTINEGIPDILPKHPGIDPTVIHAPRRKQVLSDEEKKLALKNASKANLIEYDPGSSSFSTDKGNLTENQIKSWLLRTSFLI